MTEQEFISSIDCNFPYEDIALAEELILQARSISSNAAFMVLHEILRAPRKLVDNPKRQLYERWLDGYHHPLLVHMTIVAETLLENRFLSESEVLSLMLDFEQAVGQYSALAILYFACKDKSDEVDRHYNNIIADWQAH